MNVKRREFITLLGGGVLAWPIAAHGQQAAQMRRIGMLMGFGENDPDAQTRVAAFKRGLQERNWAEGRNAQIDLRWGRGDAVRTQALAKELVALAPDVILATNTPTARALKLATATIPIVFSGLADPIADGIVASLAKPSGNITGFTSFNAAIAGKWLQILKEISPGIDRMAVLYNPSTAPYAAFLPTMQAVAPQIGVSLIQAPVADRGAIEEALIRLVSVPGGGLVLMPDVFTISHRDFIFEIANRHRLPTMRPTRVYTAAGG